MPVKIRITEDQLKLLDRLRTALSARFGCPVPRGVLLGFLAVRLAATLDDFTDEDGNLALPEVIRSFATLGKYLDERGQ
jgi:hypothetical protein